MSIRCRWLALARFIDPEYRLGIKKLLSAFRLVALMAFSVMCRRS